MEGTLSSTASDTPLYAPPETWPLYLDEVKVILRDQLGLGSCTGPMQFNTVRYKTEQPHKTPVEGAVIACPSPDFAWSTLLVGARNGDQVTVGKS